MSGNAVLTRAARAIEQIYAIRDAPTVWVFVREDGLAVRLRRGVLLSDPLIDDPHEFGSAAEVVRVAQAWMMRERFDPLVEGPGLVLAALRSGGSDNISDGRAWRVAAILTEAVYEACRSRVAEEDVVAQAAMPVIAHLRWQVMWVPSVDEGLKPWARGVFGELEDYERRLAVARTVWAQYLIVYEDFPAIGGVDVDAEARQLASASLDADLHRVDAPVGGRGRADQSFRSFITREFFCRRFLMGDVWRAVTCWPKWVVAGLLVIAAASFLVAALYNPWRSQLTMSGALVGVMAYVVLAVSVPWWTERLTYPFLLRFAASIVVGTAFVAFVPVTWVDPAVRGSIGPMDTWLVVVVGLLTSAYAYLLVEARMHGAYRFVAFGRALTVLAIGWIHALVIASVALQTIGPFIGWWVEGDATSNLRAMAILAAGSTAAAVYLQVLWEDRPVTYPLGVLRYRSS